MDHLNRGSLSIGKIDYFILDEADEMLNMGFIDDIQTIFKTTPEDKRVLLFSATMPDRIKSLARKYMREYTHVKAQSALTVDSTRQVYYEVEERDKLEAISRIIDMENAFYGLIFCRTKSDVDELTLKLLNRGYSTEALHGDMSQAQRESTLRKFRSKHITVLVATDVAARGIDVNDLTHVINHSLPFNPEAYIHRIGRTGRAGKQGTAITFISPYEFHRLGFIKRITKADIERRDIPKVNHIIDARKLKISSELQALIADGEYSNYIPWAKELLASHKSENIIAAILKYSFAKMLDTSIYKDLAIIAENKNRRQGGGGGGGFSRNFRSGPPRFAQNKGRFRPRRED
jgi:ATP-dependent RNA helicase DeaD